MAGRRALRLEGASGPRLLAWRRMARVLSLSGRLPSKGGSILRSVFLFQERLMSQSKRTKKWSAEVTAHSDALDLEPHVFSKEDPSEIAESMKRSAESSDRRKSSAFRSAMSMLNLYINRAEPAQFRFCSFERVWPQGLSLSPGAH